jgi:2,4-dienoyl-CoA reductase (NADPH2)
MRFGVETVRAMRDAVGPDFPIFYRMGAKEDRPDGVTVRQSRAFAVALENAGVDALDISLGAPTKRSASPGPKAKMGTFVPLAESIRKSVSVPVIAVGRINTGAVAESILDQDRADLIGVGRQLIADPAWPKKIKAGKAGTIVACTSCNSCFKPLRSKTWRPGDPICTVNPRVGKEADPIDA